VIIAIDGPAASGKGTLARRIAAHFGLPHLDTGLLYRGVGQIMRDRGFPLDNVEIAQVIADHDGNIDNISMKRRTQDFTDITIDLSVWDLQHLNAIIAELRGKRPVNSVDRVNG